MENAVWGFISNGKFGSYKNEENFRKYHIYITLIAELIVDYLDKLKFMFKVIFIEFQYVTI